MIFILNRIVIIIVSKAVEIKKADFERDSLGVIEIIASAMDNYVAIITYSHTAIIIDSIIIAIVLNVVMPIEVTSTNSTAINEKPFEFSIDYFKGRHSLLYQKYIIGIV